VVLIVGSAALAVAAESRVEAGGMKVFEEWLRRQTNLVTWSAEVTQTRTLKTLMQPLTAKGRVWFAAPHQFRWELGDPPQTIAVRQAEQLLVIYPWLKRVERYPMTAARESPWGHALALVDAGFPRGQAELENRFRLLELRETGDGLHTVVLEPKSPSARRVMPQIRLGIDPAANSLRYTEIRFADGSSMRNEFAGARLNPTLPEGTFEPVLEPEWEIIQPDTP
jgi:outer membrane lipoprotein-sorting protein